MVLNSTQMYLMLLFAFVQLDVYGQIAPIRHNHDAAFSTAGMTITPAGSGSLRTAGIEGAVEGFFQSYPQMLPLHVVLTNNSHRTIHLVTLRYAKRYRSDQNTVVHGTFQTHFSLRREDPSGFKNGDTVVLGPSGQVNTALAARTTLGTASVALANSMESSFSNQRYDQIIFSVDSIVFSDGLVIGPDDYDVIRQDRERNAAEKMLIEEFASRLNQGKEATTAWLRAVHGDRGVVNSKTGQPDFYRLVVCGEQINRYPARSVLA